MRTHFKPINLLASLLISLCAVFLGAKTSHSESAAPSVLRIGFIGPFSGPFAAFGEPARQGFDMGLRVSAGKHLEVTYEDDQFQALNTVNAFKRLTEAGRVNLIISLGSTTGNAIAPLAQEKNIPLISWGADSKIASGRSFVLRTYYTMKKSAALVAAEAKRLNYQNIGVIVTTSDYPLSVQKETLSRLDPTTVKYQEEMLPETRDFRPVLQKAKASGVKELFLCGLGGMAGLAAKQARESGMYGPIFGCENLADPQEYTVSQGALKDAWCYLAAMNPKWIARFRAEYRKEIALWPAALHHDLAILLDGLFAKGIVAREIFPALLQSGKHSGALKEFEFVKADGEQRIDIALEKHVVGKDTENGCE